MCLNWSSALRAAPCSGFSLSLTSAMCCRLPALRAAPCSGFSLSLATMCLCWSLALRAAVCLTVSLALAAALTAECSALRALAWSALSFALCFALDLAFLSAAVRALGRGRSTWSTFACPFPSPSPFSSATLSFTFAKRLCLAGTKTSLPIRGEPSRLRLSSTVSSTSI